MSDFTEATEVTLDEARMGEFVAAGFDANWLQGMFAKYGPGLWEFLSHALASGFTKDLLVELINKLHPLIADVLIEIFAGQKTAVAAHAPKMGAGASAAIFDGFPEGALEGPLVTTMIDKAISLLPVVLTGWKLWLAQAGLGLLRDHLKK